MKRTAATLFVLSIFMASCSTAPKTTASSDMETKHPQKLIAEKPANAFYYIQRTVSYDDRFRIYKYDLDTNIKTVVFRADDEQVLSKYMYADSNSLQIEAAQFGGDTVMIPIIRQDESGYNLYDPLFIDLKNQTITTADLNSKFGLVFSHDGDALVMLTHKDSGFAEKTTVIKFGVPVSMQGEITELNIKFNTAINSVGRIYGNTLICHCSSEGYVDPRTIFYDISTGKPISETSQQWISYEFLDEETVVYYDTEANLGLYKVKSGETVQLSRLNSILKAAETETTRVNSRELRVVNNETLYITYRSNSEVNPAPSYAIVRLDGVGGVKFIH